MNGTKQQHSGVKPFRKRHFHKSFSRTFGSVAPADLPLQVLLRTHQLPLINENLIPWSNECCTGITGFHICLDEDGVSDITYEQMLQGIREVYDHTLNMEGIFQGNPQWENVGCDLATSFNSLLVYGADYGSGQFANRRGVPYVIEQVPGLDWFDSLRSAIAINKRPISAASLWLPEMSGMDAQKVMNTPMDYNPARGSWHDWEITGYATVAGVPYIVHDAWLGNGERYMSRAQVNMLFSMNGSGLMTAAPYTGDAKAIMLSSYQTVISYLQMWLAALKK